MSEIVLLLLIATGIWYWWDTQQCNEIALTACRKHCANAGFQLLDATITRQRTWLRRRAVFSLQICRLYSFEYFAGSSSETYGTRQQGYIVLTGYQLAEILMPMSDKEKTLH